MMAFCKGYLKRISQIDQFTDEINNNFGNLAININRVETAFVPYIWDTEYCTRIARPFCVLQGLMGREK